MQDKSAGPVSDPGGNVDGFLAQTDRPGVDQITTGQGCGCPQQVVTHRSNHQPGCVGPEFAGRHMG